MSVCSKKKWYKSDHSVCSFQIYKSIETGYHLCKSMCYCFFSIHSIFVACEVTSAWRTIQENYMLFLPIGGLWVSIRLTYFIVQFNLLRGVQLTTMRVRSQVWLQLNGISNLFQQPYFELFARKLSSWVWSHQHQWFLSHTRLFQLTLGYYPMELTYFLVPSVLVPRALLFFLSLINCIGLIWQK
jgi:hypothetical protein